VGKIRHALGFDRLTPKSIPPEGSEWTER